MRRGRRRLRCGTAASPGSVAMVTGTAANSARLERRSDDVDAQRRAEPFERLQRPRARRATTSTRSDAELVQRDQGGRGRRAGADDPRLADVADSLLLAAPRRFRRRRC